MDITPHRGPERPRNRNWIEMSTGTIRCLIGYGPTMDIMRNRRQADENEEVDIIVESDEQEYLVFHGSTEDEAEAKLEDFLTWAS